MLKFLTIIVLNSAAFACALCALYTPTVHIDFQRTSVKWEFSPNFSQMLLDNFDINNDKTLDKNELIDVRAGLLDYLIPRNYLMELKYYDLPFGESKKINASVKNVKLDFKDILTLEYDIEYEFILQVDRVLVVKFEDLEGFFNFKIKENSFSYDNFAISENINLNAAFYTFLAESKIEQKIDKPQILSDSSEKNTVLNSINNIYQKIINYLAKLQSKMISLLKDNSIYLYPISLFYGFLHAMLPSHGKTLTASYFMNSKRKIAIFSLKVGFIHLINAFLIASFFGVFNMLNLGMISGFLISFLALILLYIKLSKIKLSKIKNSANNIKGFKVAKSESKVMKIIKNPNTLDNFSAFVIGLLPCPGLILVLGLLSSLGLRALVCAVFIALGMSCAIFLSAFIVTRFSFSKKIEIASLVFVFFLGLFIGFAND